MPDTLKEEQAVLRLDNVSKNFGGVVAAYAFSFSEGRYLA